MLLSAVYVLVVAQSSSEVPEGLMNNPVLFGGVSSGVAVPSMTKQTKQQHYADYLTAELKITCDADGKHNARVLFAQLGPRQLLSFQNRPRGA